MCLSLKDKLKAIKLCHQEVWLYRPVFMRFSGNTHNMLWRLGKIIMMQKKSYSGFTIIEVIVALVIVGVSITMFVRLLGNSAMLRGKINNYDERVEIAITKSEQSFLGLVETGFDLDNDKNVIQDKIEGRDINWRLEEERVDGFSGYERDVYFYTVSVEGVDISSVGLR